MKIKYDFMKTDILGSEVLQDSKKSQLYVFDGVSNLSFEM